jgi:hypothetical protein
MEGADRPLCFGIHAGKNYAEVCKDEQYMLYLKEQGLKLVYNPAQFVWELDTSGVTPPGQKKFKFGKKTGKTIEEVSREPGGISYLKNFCSGSRPDGKPFAISYDIKKFLKEKSIQ